MNATTSPATVIVGLSGGVDSAVAACLLIEQGYSVTGLHIRTLDSSPDSSELVASTLVVSDLEKYRFPVFSLNLSNSFRQHVITAFQEAYLAGKTPNPCTLCNKLIKWEGLLKGAQLCGAEYVATGHYARIQHSESSCRLLKGADLKKDQSYFLWMLGRKALEKTLFPLGEYTKPEVRQLARRFGVRAAEKTESQEICFVPDNNYREFLKSSIPGLEQSVQGGNIIDAEGSVIGHHIGYPFYTIGQRKGLGISSSEPLYVNTIDPKRNRIHVGGKQMLACSRLEAGQLNWIGIAPPERPLKALGRIRYRDQESACTIIPLDCDRIEVLFDEPKNAVTPGQTIVFYHGEELLGGGVITAACPSA